jgi:hypothetical protein
MDFITGALPNIMFIAGLVAVGIALGIEFKIVEIKGQLSKAGRIGTFSIGLLLISFSIYLYTRPNPTAPVSVASSPAQLAAVQANVAPAVALSQPTAALAPVLPVGAPVSVEGSIQQLGVGNTSTIIVIDQAQYVLPVELATRLGLALQVGVTLQLTGTRMSDGTVVVGNVIVLSATPEKPDKGKEKEHDD